MEIRDFASAISMTRYGLSKKLSGRKVILLGNPSMENHAKLYRFRTGFGFKRGGSHCSESSEVEQSDWSLILDRDFKGNLMLCKWS